MSQYLIFGTTRGDMALMIDFGRKFAIVRADTGRIEGVALEAIPPGPSGYGPGMVLIKAGWKKLYFLIERQEWDDDDYFRYATKLMNEKGIREP